MPRDGAVEEEIRVRENVRFLPEATLAAALIAASATASAQTSPGRHTLTGFGGVQLFDLGRKFDAFETELQTTFHFGGRYQYNVNERWSVEWNVLYSPGTAAPRDAGDVEIDAFYYTGGVVYHFPTQSRLVPYLAGGAGSSTFAVDGGGSDASLTLSFGGGVLYNLERGLAIRVDVRDFVSYTGSISPASLQILQLPADFEEIVHDVSVSVGISVTF